MISDANNSSRFVGATEGPRLLYLPARDDVEPPAEAATAAFSRA